MIFSELYSSYYNTVAKVIERAVKQKQPLSKDELIKIVNQYAFGESILNIQPALKKRLWQLLRPDGTTIIQHSPSMPLTVLQKRWLKAISSDPRIRLFGDINFDFPDVEPLFTADDYIVFDKYSDGDNYQDENYIANFRLILNAIKNKYPLHICFEMRRGNIIDCTVMPDHLEYSEKDDKFRLIGSGDHFINTINLSRIIVCELCNNANRLRVENGNSSEKKEVVFELYDKRKALERVLLHFADLKKQAERKDDNKYRVTVYYDEADETEILIRILSFGPMLRVTKPTHFVELIKKRLINQKSCLH